MAKRGKRQAFRMRGQMPYLADWPQATQRAAMPEMVKVTVTHVRAVAPQARGLASPKSIVSRIVGRTEADGARGVVQARAPHSHLLEYGIQAHSLAGKRKKRGHVMRIMGREDILRRGAWHPGIKARPFMQPGLAAAKDDILDALAQAGRAALEQRARNVMEVIDELAG